MLAHRPTRKTIGCRHAAEGPFLSQRLLVWGQKKGCLYGNRRKAACVEGRRVGHGKDAGEGRAGRVCLCRDYCGRQLVVR